METQTATDRSKTISPASSTAPARTTPARSSTSSWRWPWRASPASRSPPTPRPGSRSGTGASKTGLVSFLLLLMAIKFWTVAYFFMHLKFDKPILPGSSTRVCSWPSRSTSR